MSREKTPLHKVDFLPPSLAATERMATDSERRRNSNPRKIYPADQGLIKAFDTSGRTNLGHSLETVVLHELERRCTVTGYVKTEGGRRSAMVLHLTLYRPHGIYWTCLPRVSFAGTNVCPGELFSSPYHFLGGDAMRVRVFIDFWNFQLSWNERTANKLCDWKAVSLILCNEASRIISASGLGVLTLEETRVYAGYEAGRENKLKDWLHSFLDRQPGIRVFTSERHWKEQPIHCRACDQDISQCPRCGALLGKAGEKTIDARIVTDLVGLAWEDAYDVAILVSADKDFIPAVEHVQSKNYKVINAAWRGRGHQLAAVCWASFEIDNLIESLVRL